MSHPSDSKRPKFRLPVKLDLEWDADLIQWLETLPDGYRSEAVRGVIRNHLKARPGSDLEAFRKVVADEMLKVMNTVQIQYAPDTLPDALTTEELEAKFGSKLDQMLGKLQDDSSSDEKSEE
jgi:hypothetical protein